MKPARLLSNGPWGACLALLASLALGRAPAGAAIPGKAEAAALLSQFRSSIWTESTFARFDLRQMPRHGPDVLYHGRMWGARGPQGPVTRFELFGGKDGGIRRILVVGGPEASVWMTDGPGPGAPNPGAMMQPVIQGLEIAPFDLLPMPYLYWLDADLVDVQSLRGRVANVYLLTAPADFPTGPLGIRAVRAYLDAEYNALEQSEELRGDGTVAKTMSLLELRKVGSHWIPKDMDVRNEATRDKTRVTITAIAVGVPIDASVFEPGRLGALAPVPPDSQVIRITQ